MTFTILETFFWFTVITTEKVYTSLAKTSEGALSARFWCLCQKLSLSFFSVIKLLPHKSPEWSNLVPDPEAKFSSSEITNPTPFTVSYQLDMCMHVRIFESSQREGSCVGDLLYSSMSYHFFIEKNTHIRHSEKAWAQKTLHKHWPIWWIHYFNDRLYYFP